MLILRRKANGTKGTPQRRFLVLTPDVPLLFLLLAFSQSRMGQVRAQFYNAATLCSRRGMVEHEQLLKKVYYTRLRLCSSMHNIVWKGQGKNEERRKRSPKAGEGIYGRALMSAEFVVHLLLLQRAWKMDQEIRNENGIISSREDSLSHANKRLERFLHVGNFSPKVLNEPISFGA